MDEEWLDKLRADLSGRFLDKDADHIVFVGVGNRMRGDDAIGPLLADMLKDRVSHAIDAGYVPENFTSAIKRLMPDVIVFIDAVKFDGGPPGYTRLLEIEDVEKRRISVHNFSLDVVMGYLKDETGADVFMIGIQPKVIADHEELSPGLRSSLDALAGMIASILNK